MMKTYLLTKFYSRWLVAAFALAVLPSSLWADDLVLGKSGVTDGWQLQAWGGLITQPNTTVKHADAGQSLEVVVKADAAAYCGLSFNASVPIPLTDDMRKSGYVTIYIKNGKDASGKLGEAQDVQFGLTFLDAAGKPLHGKFTPTSLLAGTAESTDSSWQQIKLPIADQLATVNGSSAVSLSWIRVQCVGVPTSGFYLADCTVNKGSN